MHAAALSNNRLGVELLLAYGADPQLQDNKGRTPLELVQASDEARPEQDYSAVINRLEKAKADQDKIEASQPGQSG